MSTTCPMDLPTTVATPMIASKPQARNAAQPPPRAQ